MNKKFFSIWFIFIFLLMSNVLFSVYADGMEDFPPLPENGRGHFAIYRETSRDNRIELTMFNIIREAEEGEQLVWDNALYLQNEEKYTDDVKYYLDGDHWVQFEEGNVRISHNVNELLYADLNYLHLFLLPEEVREAELIKGDDGYYFRKKEIQEDMTPKYIFFYSRDLKDYQQIGEVEQPEGYPHCYYEETPELGRLNGELVCVFEPYSGRLPHYWTVGFSEGPLEICGMDGERRMLYKPDKSSAFVQYNWKKNCFDVSFRVVIAEAAPSGAHNTYAAYYFETYETTDFENFELVPDSYRKGLSDTIKTLVETDTYRVYYHGGFDMRYGYVTSMTPYLEKYWYEQVNGEKYEIQYEEECEKTSSENIARGGGYSTDGIYFRKNPLGKGGVTWIEGNLVCEKTNEYIGKSLIQYEEAVFVRLNDVILGFEQPPVTENGRTLIPVRFLFEQMGAEVHWEEELQRATVSFNGHSVQVKINDKIAVVDGKLTELDVPARLVNGKTMVPLRFLTEHLGCQTDWDDVYNMVIVTSPDVQGGEEE